MLAAPLRGILIAVMTYALLFSGQGAQHPAMLPWLREDDLVRCTSASLGVTNWRDRLSDRIWASRNANAQILLTGLSLAAWQQISTGLPSPSCIAGYSVGELASFAVAGVFDSYSAIKLAEFRARAMDRCGRIAPGGMLGVTGLTEEGIDAVCAETGVAIAIRNSADHVVLGGPERALDQAQHAVTRRGARGTRLCIAISSHTHWMQHAAEEFAALLARVALNEPRVLLFSNIGERIRSGAQAGDALAAQISHVVRWDDCLEEIRARSPQRVLEVGAGQALARMWNKRYPDTPARSCDDFRSAAAVARWISEGGRA
jgi:[acyl-carrier-protein] S-malonyltransferase